MLQCEVIAPELGRVGEVKTVDTSAIRAVLNEGLVPVISPIGVGSDGRAFNINADFAACRIAEALGAQKLIFLTDQDGILDADQKLISRVNPAGLEGLMGAGTVQGGMLAKTQTILHALYNGIPEVQVVNGRTPNVLSASLSSLVTSGVLSGGTVHTAQSATSIGTTCHA